MHTICFMAMSYTYVLYRTSPRYNLRVVECRLAAVLLAIALGMDREEALGKVGKCWCRTRLYGSVYGRRMLGCWVPCMRGPGGGAGQGADLNAAALHGPFALCPSTWTPSALGFTSCNLAALRLPPLDSQQQAVHLTVVQLYGYPVSAVRSARCSMWGPLTATTFVPLTEPDLFCCLTFCCFAALCFSTSAARSARCSMWSPSSLPSTTGGATAVRQPPRFRST